MTPRPVLTLVRSPAPCGAKALEFIAWAIDAFGTVGASPHEVIVARSQVALARAHGHIASQGTVSWYLAQLRRAGIVRGTRPIVVDTTALRQLVDRTDDGADPNDTSHQQPAWASTETPRVDEHRPPELAALFAQQAEQLARAVQVLGDLAATQAAIAHALLTDGTSPPDARGNRESASRPLADSREIREFRGSSVANQEGRKVHSKDIDQPPSFLDSRVANPARESRESLLAPPPTDEVLTLEEVDEIVEPLREACRRSGRPNRLDDRGRATLADLGRSALTAGVEAFAQEVAADGAMRKPLGVFVRRAEHRDPDTFYRRAPTASRPPVATHDDDCACEGRGLLPTDETLSNWIVCPGKET